MKLIILSGPCAAGKDTLMRFLTRRGAKRLISHTSRKKRPSECEGREYFFVTEEEFLRMYDDGEFINKRTYEAENGTTYYGLHSIKNGAFDPYGIYVTAADIKGAKEIRDHYRGIGVEPLLVFVTCDQDTRIVRAIERGGMTKEDVLERDRLEDDLQGDGGEDYSILVNNSGTASDLVRTAMVLYAIVKDDIRPKTKLVIETDKDFRREGEKNDDR